MNAVMLLWQKFLNTVCFKSRQNGTEVNKTGSKWTKWDKNGHWTKWENKGKINLEYDKNFEVQLFHGQFFLGKVRKLQQKVDHNIQEKRFTTYL